MLRVSLANALAVLTTSEFPITFMALSMMVGRRLRLVSDLEYCLITSYSSCGLALSGIIRMARLLSGSRRRIISVANACRSCHSGGTGFPSEPQGGNPSQRIDHHRRQSVATTKRSPTHTCVPGRWYRERAVAHLSANSQETGWYLYRSPVKEG